MAELRKNSNYYRKNLRRYPSAPSLERPLTFPVKRTADPLRALDITGTRSGGGDGGTVSGNFEFPSRDHVRKYGIFFLQLFVRSRQQLKRWRDRSRRPIHREECSHHRGKKIAKKKTQMILVFYVYTRACYLIADEIYSYAMSRVLRWIDGILFFFLLCISQNLSRKKTFVRSLMTSIAGVINRISKVTRCEQTYLWDHWRI